MSGVAEAFLAATRSEFRKLKDAVEAATAQLDDGDYFATLDPESNSIAILVKHLAGNLRSRWSDFLTTDGEKPGRDRDGEFEIHAGDTRETLGAAWEEGWRTLFATLDGLGADDLVRTVRVRAEPMSVAEAVQRQLAHTAGHVGQVVLIARHLRGAEWRTLSVPRGESREYTAAFVQRQRERAAAGGGEDGAGSGGSRTEGAQAEGAEAAGAEVDGQ
jgi:hypothetical protein